MRLCGQAHASQERKWKTSEEEWKWPIWRPPSLPRNISGKKCCPEIPSQTLVGLKNKTPQALEKNLEEISLAEFIRQGNDQMEEIHLGEHVAIWLKFGV